MRGTHEDQLAIALRQRRMAVLKWLRHAIDPFSYLSGEHGMAWRELRRLHHRVLRARRGMERYKRWLASQKNANHIDDEFNTAVAEFIGAFETVFRYDWKYTMLMWSDYEKGATFLDPGLSDEFDDWAARGFLLEKYRALVDLMKRRGLSPKFQMPLERCTSFTSRIW